MKGKFQINGIDCGECIDKIKQFLEKHSAIEETEVFLNPKGTTFIKMNEKLSIDDLQEQLNKLGGYTISEV